MHRFFVQADWLTGGNVTVSGPLVHQMRRVLRLHPGERVVFLDNSGWETEAEIISLDETTVQAVARRKVLGSGEPRTKITLFQSLLKGDHFSDVLEQCTQVGIVEFVPVVSERCIVGDVDKASERMERWQRIVMEAAEQSHRSKLPVVRPPTLLANALESVGGRGLSLIPWEDEHTTTLRSVLTQSTVLPPPAPSQEKARNLKKATASAPRRPFAVNLFIGPEGGFTPGEIAVARQYGIIPVSLGPRILRAETAGLVAATVILHEMGDMG
jgi:16S rRNA (uracil1498-N3)-methyltransferase